MLLTKTFMNFFILVVVLPHTFLNGVHGVSLPKYPIKRNATKFATILRSAKKSTASENARFLGKFSILAGLGLPDPAPLSIKREDLLYERVPSRFSASYNFPPVRWGPYFAVAYEPTPIFVRNPLAFIISALNPLNWFAGTESTSEPETTASGMPTNGSLSNSNNQHENDVLVLLKESANEIGNGEMEMRDGKEEYADKSTIITVTDNPETTEEYHFSDASTISDDDYPNTDLIAEETTLNLNGENNKRIGEESRQSNRRRTTSKKGSTTKKTSSKTTKKAAATTTTDEFIEETTMNTFPSTITETTNEYSIENSTENAFTSSTYSSSNATRPTQPNFHPGYYHNGYYYGGQPQNVAHVRFTTQQPDIITNAISTSFEEGNNGNLFIQQNQPNFAYDNYDQSQLNLQNDRSFNQYSPQSNKDYFPKPLDFLNNDVNTIDQLNGFKPSYPYYH